MRAPSPATAAGPCAPEGVVGGKIIIQMCVKGFVCAESYA